MPGPLGPGGLLDPSARTAPAVEAEAVVEKAFRGKGAAKNSPVEAAKNFESLMVAELMRTMRSTVPEGEDGFAMKTAWGMFDEAISDAASGGLGLAPMIARDLGASEEEVRAMSFGASGPSGREAALRLGVNPAEGPGAPSNSPVRAAQRYARHLPPPGERIRAGVLDLGRPQPGLMPVEGVVSSPFGWRTHPITGDRRFHEGVDIAAPEGTEIRAVQSGVVRFAGRRGGYGNVVELEHPDGSVSRYAHASRVHVRRGDRVEVGESVADVGQTGHATGPHLHFQVERDGKAVDPNAYLSDLRVAHKGP